MMQDTPLKPRDDPVPSMKGIAITTPENHPENGKEDRIVVLSKVGEGVLNIAETRIINLHREMIMPDIITTTWSPTLISQPLGDGG